MTHLMWSVGLCIINTINIYNNVINIYDYSLYSDMLSKERGMGGDIVSALGIVYM